jgi:alanine racemase
VIPARPRLTIDLDALAANFRTLRTEARGAEVAPVVKADAYGLGAAQIGKRLAAEGATTFFVARHDEGVTLRAAIGPGPAILVLDGSFDGSADLTPVLSSPNQVVAWGGHRPVALQVDTGLNRLGLRPDELDVAQGLNVSLVITHLACGATRGHPFNLVQRDTFRAVAARFPAARASLAASAGIFLGEDFRFDVVRPGIALYGGGPFEVTEPKLRPVATLEAPILQLRDLQPGDTVGYARSFTATEPMRVAIVAIGYADGLLRRLYPDGHCFVGGARRRVLGRISMDAMTVDVTGCNVREGDPVELFGPNLPIDEAATACGTLSYELLTRAPPARVEKLYR